MVVVVGVGPGNAFAQSGGDYLEAGAVQCPGHGGQLGDDILAVASLFDHRDHPRELSLGPAQPIRDRGNGVFVTNHGVTPSELCPILPAGVYGSLKSPQR